MTAPSLPVSPALAEATESLSEFMSRNPAEFSRADRDRLVKVLREQRARFEAAEASGKRAPGRGATPIERSRKSASELGF